MNSTQKTVYFFFAPWRSGNHWAEAMLAGLYYFRPIFLTDEKGFVREDLEENYGTNHVLKILEQDHKPYIPPVTPEKPVLFLEYCQPHTKEMIDRGNEINLDLLRDLATNSDQEHADVLTTQWFHGKYHATPFVPQLPEGIESRFWFVERSPQAVAWSYFHARNQRWRPSGANPSVDQPFLESYTQEYLRDLFDWYLRSREIAKYYKAAFLRYEELLQSSLPLHRLVSECCTETPKQSIDKVWEKAKFQSLVCTNQDRSFYRVGKANSWLNNVDESTLQQMIEIEQPFDFSQIDYLPTRQLIDQRDEEPNR